MKTASAVTTMTMTRIDGAWEDAVVVAVCTAGAFVVFASTRSI
jgi:hypothetical protein